MTIHTRETMQAAIQTGYDEGRSDRHTGGYVSIKDARMYELQQQIADEAATAEVECSCLTVRENDLVWHDVSELKDEPEMGRTLEYLHLRGLIEYSADGKLVRLVEH